MASSETDRLEAIKQDFNTLLESRVGDLMGAVRATQEVTRQLIAAEEEIRRQTLLREHLDAELARLVKTGSGLDAETSELKAKIAKLHESVDRRRSLRDELMSNLANLKGELGDE